MQIASGVLEKTPAGSVIGGHRNLGFDRPTDRREAYRTKSSGSARHIRRSKSHGKLDSGSPRFSAVCGHFDNPGLARRVKPGQ